MNVDTLRLFVDVARRGSFTAVAHERDVAPSSISRSIAQLERELGTRLFQRTTRQVAPTEAGERLLGRVDELLAAADALVEAAREPSCGPSGTLRLSASVAFGERVLVPLLDPFRKRYPAVRIELVLTDRSVDLVGEGIDLAVRLGEVRGAELVATRLMSSRYRAVASPGWVGAIAASEALRTPADLSRHDCVLIDLAGHRSEWHWRDASDPTDELRSVPVDGSLRCSSALGVRGCALRGLGPALLADWLIDDDVAAGRLVDLFPSYAITATDFDTAAWIVYPSREWLPAKVRAMIDFLEQRLRYSDPARDE